MAGYESYHSLLWRREYSDFVVCFRGIFFPSPSISFILCRAIHSWIVHCISFTSLPAYIHKYTHIYTVFSSCYFPSKVCTVLYLLTCISVQFLLFSIIQQNVTQTYNSVTLCKVLNIADADVDDDVGSALAAQVGTDLFRRIIPNTQPQRRVSHLFVAKKVLK